jgi:hypothetical protein
MKFIVYFFFVLLLSSDCFSNQVLYPEYYWLGFVDQNEKEFGTNRNPYRLILSDHIHEKDSLEMNHITKYCSVKFKRAKYIRHCSNCHQWFDSKEVNKDWTFGKYYDFTEFEMDSNSFKWYTPKFKSDFVLNANEFQKISFITGLFLRCGIPDSANYSLTLIESPGKAECVLSVLKSLECINVTMTLQNNTSMDGIIVNEIATIVFKPSAKIMTYFGEVVEIRRRQLSLTPHKK